jgi:RNA polymerase nonessential primary-like sigma factor
MMPATSFYADAEFDPSTLEHSSTLSEAEFDPNADFADLEAELASQVGMRAAARKTTDLVRLYLQEIGRYRLLGRDEEVSEAQKVQRYMKLLDQRNDAANKGNAPIRQYVDLIDARDRLVSTLTHRPSLERWAAEAKIEVKDLKPKLAEGNNTGHNSLN